MQSQPSPLQRLLWPQSKMARILNWTILIILVTYVGVLVFPGFLFSHSVKYQNFNVHGTVPLDNQIHKILDEAVLKLSASEINDEQLTHDIYLCNNYGLYTFLAPLSRKAFACNYPLFNNIFIAMPDIANNLAYKNDIRDSYSRELSSLIAHEVTHTLIEKKIGFVKFKQLPAWKNEGYCDYIGLGKKEITDQDLTFLKSQDRNITPGEKYQKYYLVVNYLMQSPEMDFITLMNNQYDTEQLLTK